MPRLKTLLLLTICPIFCFAASFPSSGFGNSNVEKEEVIITQTKNSPTLGITYNVTMGDGTNGTFQTTFDYQTPGTPAPGAWYTLAGGKGLYEDDIINFTDLGESYTLVYSEYNNYYKANGAGTALGAYSYFLAVPLGNGEFIFIGFCLAYILFLVARMFYRKMNSNI